MYCYGMSPFLRNCFYYTACILSNLWSFCMKTKEQRLAHHSQIICTEERFGSIQLDRSFLLRWMCVQATNFLLLPRRVFYYLLNDFALIKPCLLQYSYIQPFRIHKIYLRAIESAITQEVTMQPTSEKKWTLWTFVNVTHRLQPHFQSQMHPEFW